MLTDEKSVFLPSFAEDKYEKDDEDNLVVSNVTLDDEGTYKCSARQVSSSSSDYQTFEIQAKVQRKNI